MDKPRKFPATLMKRVPQEQELVGLGNRKCTIPPPTHFPGINKASGKNCTSQQRLKELLKTVEGKHKINRKK